MMNSQDIRENAKTSTLNHRCLSRRPYLLYHRTVATLQFYGYTIYLYIATRTFVHGYSYKDQLFLHIFFPGGVWYTMDYSLMGKHVV